MKKKLVSTIDFIVTGEKFDVVLDLDTEVAQTVPCPNEEKMLDYYRSTKYHSHNKPSGFLISSLYNFVQKVMFKNKLDLIKKYVKEGSRLLDFGSGLGRFPIYANKIYKTYAVEPITYKSNFAVKKGIEVKKSINNFKKEYNINTKTVYGDATVLKTMIRSNPGFFLMRNGTVKAKWHHNSFPEGKEILKKVNITI